MCLMSKAISERLFEQYLSGRGIAFEYESTTAGKRWRPDYAIEHRRSKIVCEVKEFPRPSFIGTTAGTFDPFPRVRRKIQKAAAQFREYKIWGAMLGTPAVSVPIDTRDGSSGSGEEKMVFTTKGKMVRYKDGRPHQPQNTTISAILVLDHLLLGRRRVRAQYRNPDKELETVQRARHCREQLQAAQGTRCDPVIRELRVVIYENPYARRRLARTLFRGPFDERFGTVAGGRIERLFAGRGLLDLEDEEAEAHSKRL